MRASRRAGSTCSSSTERGAVFRRTPTAWKPNRMRAVIGRIVAAAAAQRSRPSSQAAAATPPDQHQLVRHVEGEAPAAEERQPRERPRQRSGEHGLAVAQQPVGRRRAPPHDAEPGQHRHVVLGHRQVRDQADPVGGPAVEERMLHQPRQGDRDRAERARASAPHDAVKRTTISISAMPCSTPKLIQVRGNMNHEAALTSSAQPAICAQRLQNRGQRLALVTGDLLPGAGAEQEQGDDAGALQRSTSGPAACSAG